MIEKQKRKKNTVHFDNIRAKKVFSLIKLEWDKREKSGVFRGLILPQDNYISSELSNKDIALFFFYAVLAQRGGISSDQPLKVWWRFREKTPGVFNPITVEKYFSPEKILYGLKDIIGINGTNQKGFRLEEISNFWYYNSIKLLKYWDGDPRNLFKKIRSFDQAWKKIAQAEGKTVFKGIGMKIFALLTIYLQEKNVIPFFPTPLPVDFHTMRILWTTGIVKKSGWINPCVETESRPKQLIGKPAINIYHDFPNTIAIWSQRFMEKNGFSHLEMNPAIWLLSRSFCSKHFQNRSKNRARQYIDTSELKRNPDLWPKNYHDFCSICPIEKYCKWIISSAPYWKWGLLVKLGRRIPYSKI